MFGGQLGNDDGRLILASESQQHKRLEGTSALNGRILFQHFIGFLEGLFVVADIEMVCAVGTSRH